MLIALILLIVIVVVLLFMYSFCRMVALSDEWAQRMDGNAEDQTGSSNVPDDSGE